MKKLIVILISLLILVGCSTKAEQDFEGFASDFYVQMFSDGEQSEKASEMHKELKRNYKDHADEELYISLDGMYKELATGDIKSQLKVMELINE